MTCSETTKGAVDALARASSADDLWSVFKSIGANYGYDHILACRVSDQGQTIAFTNMPAPILRSLDRSGFAAGLPVEHVLAAPRPFLASEAPLPLTADQRRTLERAKEALGVTEVLFLPLHDNGVAEGYVIAAGRDPVSAPVVRSSLHILAQLAFQGAAGNTAKRKGPNLSPREAECLRLAAQGNTDTHIGRILNISPRTTRFHIENAKKKLGVTTRTQAVAEALRLNAFAA